MQKKVTPATRISVLKALVGRTFGVNVRKRRVRIVDGEDGEREGMSGTEVGEGDSGGPLGGLFQGGGVWSLLSKKSGWDQIN